jgi:hypothetical protein
MTEEEIEKFKDFLQKKIDILIPKKVKGVKNLKIVNIDYNPPLFRDGGSLEITIDASFDYSGLTSSDIPNIVKKTSSFVKGLANVVEPNKVCYLYWV